MRKRAGTGQALLEVICGIVCLVPVVIILFDLVMIFVGVQTNESLCANAVSVVASGAPEDADKRARIIVQGERSSGTMITGFRLVAPPVIKLDNKFQYAEPLRADSEPIGVGQCVTGTATVATEVEIQPLLVHRLYGGGASLKFRSEKSKTMRFIRPGRAALLTN